MTENVTYSSQLKGWAIDRAIELRRANKSLDETPTAEEIIADADKLLAYSFSPYEAEQTIADRMQTEEYDRQMAAAVAMNPASNRSDVDAN